MAKALNDKIPREKFSFPPLFNAIWKTLLLLMLVLIFFPFPFLFQVSISPDPIVIMILWLVG